MGVGRIVLWRGLCAGFGGWWLGGVLFWIVIEYPRKKTLSADRLNNRENQDFSAIWKDAHLSHVFFQIVSSEPVIPSIASRYFVLARGRSLNTAVGHPCR